MLTVSITSPKGEKISVLTGLANRAIVSASDKFRSNLEFAVLSAPEKIRNRGVNEM